MFVLSLWLPDEAKIETKQEEDEMDDGAATADLRCFDKTCSQQRHRNIGEIRREQNSRLKEECRRQTFAKVPISPGEIEAPDSHDDGGGDVEGYSHACLADQAVLGRTLTAPIRGRLRELCPTACRSRPTSASGTRRTTSRPQPQH